MERFEPKNKIENANSPKRKVRWGEWNLDEDKLGETRNGGERL